MTTAEAPNLDTLAADAQSAIPADGALGRIASLAARQCELEDQIDALDETRKTLSADLQRVKMDELPAAMAEVGLSDFRLTDGSRVRLSAYVSHTLSASNPDREKAYQWLEENGHGDLLKRTVSVSLARGDEEHANLAREMLAAAGLDPEEQVKVEPATLGAFLKEMVAKGEPVPLEWFRATVGQASKIDRPK